jgi:thiamine-phosphate pyrophosphorylase
VKLVVISPESGDPREVQAMGALFGLGLARYHVRKPAWGEREIADWLGALPRDWLPRIVLHRHHGLARALGLGGSHGGEGDGSGTSGSCHDVGSIGPLARRLDYLFFGPVFPSLSKPGHGPAADFPWGILREALRGKSGGDVYAVGGVTAGGLPRLSELGFDGAAVLGAVWGDPDPVRAFARVSEAAGRLGSARHAA